MKWICMAIVAVLMAGCGPSGCGTLPGTGGIHAAAEATPIDERVVLGAEAAFQTTLVLVGAAVDAGQLKGAAAKKTAVILDKAHKALIAARTAYNLGNADEMQQQITLAQNLVGEISSLVKKEN